MKRRLLNIKRRHLMALLLGALLTVSTLGADADINCDFDDNDDCQFFCD